MNINWTAHPYIYQLTHWWHWLTYGQNATVLALVGLAYYTRYTRRMMAAAEETRRLSLTPYLLSEFIENSNPLSVIITNVAAPAVNCSLWMQVVSDQFKLGLRLKRAPGTQEKRISSVKSGDEPLFIPLLLDNEHPRVLYVLECHDTAGGLYQLQLLQELKLITGEVTIENLFLAPDTFLPWWKRLIHRVLQLWQIYIGKH